MDGVTVFVGLVAVVAVLVALDARWQIAALRSDQEKDANYYEWWMRSMEERKANKEAVREDADDDGD